MKPTAARARRRLADLSARLRATLARRPFDLVLVVAPQNRGWILDGIAREVAALAPGRVHVDYSDDPPPARAYLFLHYSLYPRHRRRLRRGARQVVWFTHPSHPLDEIVRWVDGATHIAAMCTPHAQMLAAAGLRSPVSVVLAGADPARFTPHDRGSGAIGFCSAHYPRKRPELIVELVQAMPDRRFRLLGRGWADRPELAALRERPNFEYLEDTYDTYPAFYDSIDVLVSPSTLEGGPIPVIEAMMANVVPVASDTGFARDVITPGVNGFICATDAPVECYVAAVEEALRLRANIRATVEHLTWQRCATEVLGLLGDQ